MRMSVQGPRGNPPPHPVVPLRGETSTGEDPDYLLEFSARCYARGEISLEQHEQAAETILAGGDLRQHDWLPVFCRPQFATELQRR
jgi:hypothetical protein